MKYLTISLLLVSQSVFSAGVYPNIKLFAAGLSLSSTGIGVPLSTTNLALTSTTIHSNPQLGVIILADGETLALDLDNELVLEEIENIQILIEEGFELNEQQKTILAVGINSSQLDQFGNILRGNI